MVHSRLSLGVIAGLLLGGSFALGEIRIPSQEAMKAAVQKPQPEYTQIARQMKVSGRVEVEAAIATDGSVDSVRVISGNPLLTAPTVTAVRKWKFTPFQENGAPAKALAVLAFDFKQDGNRRVNRQTIGTRLTVAFGGLGLALLVLGLTSLKMTEGLGGQLEAAVNEMAREQVLAGQLSTAASDMNVQERGVAFSTVLQQTDRSRKFKAEFALAASRARLTLDELRPLATDARLKHTVEELDTQLGSLAANHVEMSGLLESGQMDAALKYFDETMVPRLAALGETSKRLAGMAQQQLAEVAAGARGERVRNRWVTIILLLVSLAVSAGVAFEVTRSTRALRRLTGRMQAAAMHVGEASQQIAGASDSLAQGASRQAGSLQETSSSSQQMSSLTQRNAENARQVTRLMAEVDHRVRDANRTLDQMAVSIQEINGSSEKIARIIKVIDEISFQTNILALNAAVEAARAGEAGMGFAVVADEVRSLAQRCAQAARDTTTLIEESIQTAGGGAQKLALMTEAVRSITAATAEVKRLAEEVNLGSDEQARGIEHVAHTLTQMEQVTQQVASSAQESASAANSMSAQAHDMNEVVTELVALAGQGG